MVRRRSARSRSPRYPRRWPWVIGLNAGAAVAVGSLAGLAYLSGRGRPAGVGAPLDAVLVTIAKPGPALALAFAALTFLAWCGRRLALEWLAWRPGRISVPDFAAGSELNDADPAQLTARFRQRLATLRLQSPAPVPGAAPEGDFLEVLGRAGADGRNPLGSLLGLLRAAKPTHAWQVHGILTERDASPRCGVTVQVTRLPHEGHPPTTVWSDTWGEALMHAADHATAAILPRTHLCRAPWSAWRRFVMPGGLLGVYEEGARLETERRYDEALDAYFRAVAADPMNVTLRLRIGQLQEKLGLYLDALSTYEAISALGEPQDASSFRRVLVLLRRRYRLLAVAERRDAMMAARYRRIVLLGGSELAEQWRKAATGDGPPTVRDERRQELRDRLRRQLHGVLSAADATHRGRAAVDPAGTQGPIRTFDPRPSRRIGSHPVDLLLAEPAAGPGRRGTERDHRVFLELRELFALAALDQVHGLLRQARRHIRNRQRTLTPAGVRLTALCIQERLAFIQHQLAGEGGPVWPPTVDDIGASIAAIEPGAGFTRWHEHYNAACAYALPLLSGTFDRDPHRAARAAFAERAVERLADATAGADSAHIASRRDWLLSEDPDLDGLRVERAFKDFEAVYFPARRPTPPRPRHVHHLENARYVRAILLETARRWEEVWHRRGRTLDRRPDVHVTLGWWDDESRAWELVRAVSIHHRDWRSRLELVTGLRDAGLRYGFEPGPVAFTRYEDEPLSAAELDDDRDAVRTAVAAADRRLAGIADAIPDDGEARRARTLLHDMRRWQATLRQLDRAGRGPHRFLLAPLCDHHAALWQLLREWLDAEGAEQRRAAELAFQRQVADTAALWCTALDQWSTGRAALRALTRPHAAGDGAPPMVILRLQLTDWWQHGGRDGSRRLAEARAG